jgi:long-chain acyl-CoA synthetase
MITAARPAPDRRGVLTPPSRPGVTAGDVDPDTMLGVWLRQSERLDARVSLQVKRDDEWLPVSWREVRDSVTAVGAALVHAGIDRGDRVAILSENRVEWYFADFALQALGAVVVPIYASSTAEMVAQVLGDSGAVAVICSTAAQAAKVTAIAEHCPALRLRIVLEGEVDGFVSVRSMVAEATPEDVDVFAERSRVLRRDDVLTIIYTSGTTGVPKGVVLTHRNVVESCRALLQVVTLRDDDHGLSILPWAHVFERVQGIFIGIMAGVPGAIANDLDHIGEDLRAVRPTLMNGVPRVYEKMQETIIAQIRSAGGRRAELGLRAIADATEFARLRRVGAHVPPALRLRCVVWERLVLDRIRAGMGGRVRFFSSGGGPINLATQEFFDALGITISEGYGLTETTGGVTTNDPDAARFGTVGKATPGHELRIASDGEILVRGPGVMQGYFNNEEATRQVLQDGWFATGDIGEIDSDGFLRITDRKKDLIVTAGGKNIAPQPIEAALMQDPLVERAVVIGDRRKYLVALIVPAFGALRQWATANGVTGGHGTALAADKRVVELYTGLAEQASAGLARYETIKKVAVLDRDLEESRGELTPTLKVKRSVIARDFAEVIDALYG